MTLTGTGWMLKFVDSAAVSGTKETAEGYLIADAFAVRTGIQNYHGFELGRADLSVVRVYRPEDEVFAVDSLKSFAHIPVTVEHPSQFVDASNWRDLAVGETSTDVLRDGERLRIPLVVKDKAAIDAIKDGKRELSAGYTCELDFTPGKTKDGVAYDAVQRNIRANHLAVVSKGRAGSDFRIGDAAGGWGVAPVTDNREFPMNTRTIMVDGLSVVCTDQGAAAIEKLTQDRTTLRTELESATSTHAQTVAAKDQEIGTLKADLKKAQDAIPTGAMLDALVQARAALVDAARKVAKDIVVDGKSDADIRRETVAKVLGADMVKDQSDDVVLGMFQAVTKDAGNAVDPARAALRGSAQPGAPATTPTGVGQLSDSQKAYQQRLADAWKTGGVKASA